MVLLPYKSMPAHNMTQSKTFIDAITYTAKLIPKHVIDDGKEKKFYSEYVKPVSIRAKLEVHNLR